MPSCDNKKNKVKVFVCPRCLCLSVAKLLSESSKGSKMIYSGPKVCGCCNYQEKKTSMVGHGTCKK